MEIIEVCRICLVMDVNMYDLQTQPWESYFEPIIGSPLNAIELPPFACFECAALVKKYYYFRERCLRGQATLQGILHSSGTITKQEIQKINRPSFQLTSNLTIHEVIQDNVIYHVYDEDSAVGNKKSTALEDDKHMLKIEINIKEEECVDNHTHLSHLFTSEGENNKDECLDELPLLTTKIEESFRKRIAKEKETKKNRKCEKKKVAVYCLENTKVPDYGTEISTELTKTVPTKSKGGLRSKKCIVKKQRRTVNTGEVHDGDDLIGDLEEYVTIVKLSVEEQMEEVNKRQQSSNYLNSPYQCKLCYKGFVYTHAWEHHVTKHDPSAGVMECPVCKLRFKSKCSLYKHALNHEIKYVCKSCSYVSTSITQAKRHQRWHKGVTYKCQYCGEVSTKWTSYLSHVRIKHPSEFICDVCGYSFVSQLGLALHKTRMHKDLAQDKNEEDNDKDAGLYCKECDVKFISVDAFKRHVVTSVKHTHVTHSNGCRVCGKTFINAEELRTHRREHARKFLRYYGTKPHDTSWPFKCEHCSEELSNGRDYWNHFRRAHPDKDYPVQKNHVCDICGKCFQSITFLVYHQRTHSEERAFKCSTCGKAFRNKGYLQLHEKTHSDARPYPCTVCLKAFKFKGALDRHSRCHTGVKPFECEVCGKAFTQSNSRKLHIRTVHMKQPAPPRSRLQRKNKT